MQPNSFIFKTRKHMIGPPVEGDLTVVLFSVISTLVFLKLFKCAYESPGSSQNEHSDSDNLGWEAKTAFLTPNMIML